MFALALLLQAASAPPIPPPPREPYLAALALWQENAPSEAERRLAIDRAVRMATSGALNQVGVEVIYSQPRSYDRWYAKFKQMQPLLERHVPADLKEVDTRVAGCVINDLAYTLSFEEIAAVRAFAKTGAGRKFWSVSGAFHETMQECYRMALNLSASREDFIAVGLQPPKPVKPVRQRENVVS